MQTAEEVLAPVYVPCAETPALFVPPAASEAFIWYIKCCFWWASGSVRPEWEIQAAYKTLPGLNFPAWLGWVKQTQLLSGAVRAADPQLCFEPKY